MARRQTRLVDLPRSDLRHGHGRGIDGYFWRFSDAATGRVVVAFCGVNAHDRAPAWGNVGIAAHPGGHLVAADLPRAAASLDGLDVLIDDPGPAGTAVLSADPDSLSVHLGAPSRSVGDGGALTVRLTDRREWTAPWLGGVGAAQLLPGLAHYWHPYLLDASVAGTLRLGGETWDLTGWRAYGEHTWGRGGFPPRWWWGQAHGADLDGLTLAFAGGSISRRVPELSATGLVLATAAGRRWCFGNPLRAPVRADVGVDSWRLRGRSPGWSVEVEGTVPSGDPSRRLLPVPDPRAGRSTPQAAQHLAGQISVTLRRRGVVQLAAESQLAGLESGGQ